MKRISLYYIFLFIFTITNILSFIPSHTYSSVPAGISINVNGQRIYPDVPPIIKNSRTLVPLKGIFEKLGASAQWIQATRNIVLKYKDKNIILKIGSTTAFINGAAVKMDVAPEILNSRTMIPLGFISKNIGMWAEWVPELSLAAITDPSYFTVSSGMTVLGFTTNEYKGDDAPFKSLINNYNNLSRVATFSYSTDTDGNLKLIGYSQEASVKFAISQNIKPFVLINNLKEGKFDRDLAHTVLSDEKKRKTLIDNIFMTICKEEYAGVNIDIEGLYWYDREFYSSFIRELKAKISIYGYLTTVSIPAKTYDTFVNDNWSGAFDYREIGKYADQILLMTYDEHYFGSSAGPIASFPWVENVMKYATGIIPSEKILLGIAGYGYDWSAEGNRAIAFKRIDSIMTTYNSKSVWDDKSKSPYFIYFKNGISHEVWYENGASIALKIGLVDKYKLGGIGIWKLGYENEAFWLAIKSGLDL